MSTHTHTLIHPHTQAHTGTHTHIYAHLLSLSHTHIIQSTFGQDCTTYPATTTSWCHHIVSNLVEKAKLIVKHYCNIVFSFYSPVCVLSCGSWLVRMLPPAPWAAPLAGWDEWHLLSSYETSSPVLSASVERQGLDAPQCNCLQTSACQQPCWNICICCF